MNIKTIRFDADKWQLMPKVATDEMNAAAAYTETFAEAYTALLAAAPQPEIIPGVNIDEAVNRFLVWELPDYFRPDGGVKLDPIEAAEHWPTGTNLFTAEQAKEMFEYCLQPLPQPEPLSPWLPIDEFLKSPTKGACWLFIKDEVCLAYCVQYEDGEIIFFEGDSSTVSYYSKSITHVMPITKPQAPTGATAPEVE